MSKFIGIDINKHIFELVYQQQDKWNLCQLFNPQKSIKTLLSHLGEEDCVVMEANSPYYVPLATYLHDKGYKVVVENPSVNQALHADEALQGQAQQKRCSKHSPIYQ